MTEYNFLKKCRDNYSNIINFDNDDELYWYDVFLTSFHAEDGERNYRNDLTRIDLADYVHDFKDLRKISRETTIPVPVLRRFLNGGELLRIWQTVLTKWTHGDSPVADVREARFYRKHQLYTKSDIDDMINFLNLYPSGVAAEAAGLDRAEVEANMCGITPDDDEWN